MCPGVVLLDNMVFSCSSLRDSILFSSGCFTPYISIDSVGGFPFLHPLIICSVQVSPSVMSDTLQTHGLQHTRPPCPSPTPRVYSNPCPWSQWCHPTISFCHPLLLLLSIFPSIRVFSNESVLRIRWPKYWSFSFNISPSNECSGLISFRMDWVDLLAVQGTLKSLLQHHSSKSINSWALSRLYSPTLTPIHDHWKNHSFDYMDLCWQSNVSAFYYAV